MSRIRRYLPRALLGAGTAVLLLGAAVLANHYYGSTGAAPARQAALPAALSPQPEPSPSPSTRTVTAPATGGSAAAPGGPMPASTSAAPAVAPDRPGVPVQILVPSHGLTAKITADPLLPDGYVYVPRDPRVVSWTSGTGTAPYSSPGSDRGTAMLVSHINYSGVAGAFHDLASYQPGQLITLVLQDGRRLDYTVAAKPLLVGKAELDADLRVAGQPLHHELYGQTARYGRPGAPLSGRLLLQSCGGQFDNRTGSYQDNVFVFALPAG